MSHHVWMEAWLTARSGAPVTEPYALLGGTVSKNTNPGACTCHAGRSDDPNAHTSRCPRGAVLEAARRGREAGLRLLGADLATDAIGDPDRLGEWMDQLADLATKHPDLTIDETDPGTTVIRNTARCNCQARGALYLSAHAETCPVRVMSAQLRAIADSFPVNAPPAFKHGEPVLRPWSWACTCPAKGYRTPEAHNLDCTYRVRTMEERAALLKDGPPELEHGPDCMCDGCTTGTGPEPLPDPAEDNERYREGQAALLAEITEGWTEPMGLTGIELERQFPFGGPGLCEDCHLPIKVKGPGPRPKRCAFCTERHDIANAVPMYVCNHGGRRNAWVRDGHCRSCGAAVASPPPHAQLAGPREVRHRDGTVSFRHPRPHRGYMDPRTRHRIQLLGLGLVLLILSVHVFPPLIIPALACLALAGLRRR